MAYLITAIIKPHKIDEVKDALKAEGLMGMTVTEVRGFGRQGGKTEVFRGSEYTVDFVPKLKIEVLAPESAVDKVVELILSTARTGKIGDGKVWAVDLARLARVRTGEMGDEAI